MDIISFVLKLIKTELLILIPVTWIFGMCLKKCLVKQSPEWIARLIKNTDRLKKIICVFITMIAIVIGFIFSDFTGLKRVADAFVIYGLHGVVCVALATRLYDKVREQ